MGAEQHAQRLDKALAELVPEFSRSYLQQLLLQGCIRLNGREVQKPASRVKAGDRIAVEMRPTQQSQAFRPEQWPLDVMYEDEHILVIHKPAGLVVHPAPGNWSGTLLNALLGRDAQAMQVPRAGIVHRPHDRCARGQPPVCSAGVGRLDGGRTSIGACPDRS